MVESNLTNVLNVDLPRQQVNKGKESSRKERSVRRSASAFDFLLCSERSTLIVAIRVADVMMLHVVFHIHPSAHKKLKGIRVIVL